MNYVSSKIAIFYLQLVGRLREVVFSKDYGFEVFTPCRRSSINSLSFLLFIANFIRRCQRSDPNLGECLKGTIESMRPEIANGIPELFIPPCEPLQIPEIRIKQNAGAIRMESVYSDILMSGLSNFTLRKCSVDKDLNRTVVDFWFPSVKMTAKYNIHGKVRGIVKII